MRIRCIRECSERVREAMQRIMCCEMERTVSSMGRRELETGGQSWGC